VYQLPHSFSVMLPAEFLPCLRRTNDEDLTQIATQSCPFHRQLWTFLNSFFLFEYRCTHRIMCCMN